MRIALVTEAFHPAVDADTAIVKQLIDHHVDAGHQVLLVTAAPGLASYRGCRVVRTGVGDLRGLDGFEPDVVQVHSPGTLGSRALAEAAAAGLPTLVVQSVPVASAARWRRTVDTADRVLATSDWLARELGGVDGVWRPGVDTAAFGPQLRSEYLHDHWSLQRYAHAPLTVVGHVGDLRRSHGVRRLAELGDLAGIRTVVIGAGSQRGWLRRRLPQARFAAPLSRGELAVALASLDVLVETAPGRTGGALLREAAASGVPVVSLAGGGAEEVVEHGQTGLLHPDRPGALAATLDSLAHDPTRRAVLGYQARVAVEDRDASAAAAELDRWASAVVRPRARRRPSRRRTTLLTG